ncbi:MAG TPA: hypothetical protein VMS98_09575 [Thermoanaerobaculia bacterium]|nr:hypothetical protein [Thermoanaerobaculia bacterium]
MNCLTRPQLFTRDRRDLRGLHREDYVRAFGTLDRRGVLHVRDIDIVRNSRRAATTTGATAAGNRFQGAPPPVAALHPPPVRNGVTIGPHRGLFYGAGRHLAHPSEWARDILKAFRDIWTRFLLLSPRGDPCRSVHNNRLSR